MVWKRRAVWGTRNGVLLAAALISGAVAWWLPDLAEVEFESFDAIPAPIDVS